MESLNPFIWLFGDPLAEQEKINRQFSAAARRLKLARKKGNKQAEEKALRDMAMISKTGQVISKKALHIANTPERVTATASKVAASVTSGIKVAALGGFVLAAFGLWVVLKK